MTVRRTAKQIEGTLLTIFVNNIYIYDIFVILRQGGSVVPNFSPNIGHMIELKYPLCHVIYTNIYCWWKIQKTF